MRTQCKFCVMDKSAEEITFDENGRCNFCIQAQNELESIKKLDIKDILSIKGDKYDCLIGLSGGIDSATALVKAVEMGLRPLCFSVDNGWNNPVADENVMNLVEGLKVPFFRYVIDREKFRDLLLAFINSGVKNIEIPTDHILMAVSYEIANKYNIKTIISGGNVATESIMPPSWGYNARDLVHIKDIYKKHTGKNNIELPTCSLIKWNYYKWIKRIKIIYILDYFNYDRKKSIEELKNRFNFKDYYEKHCESYLTWWFQNYYLFEKFSIDKRKAHLSSLINSGQITRREALEELGKNPEYPNLGIENTILKIKKGYHEDYKKDNYELIAKIIKWLF